MTPTEQVEGVRQFRAVRLANDKLITLVDAEDYDRVVEAGPWVASYYRGRPNRVKMKRTRIYLHHFVLNQYPPEMHGLEMSHVNMNALDNRKANLRWTTHSENLHQLPVSKMSRTGHKNIQLKHMHYYENKSKKKSYTYFQPVIMHEGAYVKTLVYKTLPEAIAARDEIYKQLGYTAEERRFEIDHEKYWEEAEPIKIQIKEKRKGKILSPEARAKKLAAKRRWKENFEKKHGMKYDTWYMKNHKDRTCLNAKCG